MHIVVHETIISIFSYFQNCQVDSLAARCYCEVHECKQYSRRTATTAAIECGRKTHRGCHRVRRRRRGRNRCKISSLPQDPVQSCIEKSAKDTTLRVSECEYLLQFQHDNRSYARTFSRCSTLHHHDRTILLTSPHKYRSSLLPSTDPHSTFPDYSWPSFRPWRAVEILRDRPASGSGSRHWCRCLLRSDSARRHPGSFPSTPFRIRTCVPGATARRQSCRRCDLRERDATTTGVLRRMDSPRQRLAWRREAAGGAMRAWRSERMTSSWC